MADLVVVGGGISGASLAFRAARAGRAVVVVEADGAAGGCLATAQHPSGFWFELGAHTFYNSYGATLELLFDAGLRSELEVRGKPVLRLLDAEGRLLPGTNLFALLRRLGKLELLCALPRWPGVLRRPPSGDRTVREHYSELVGARNYARVLGPLLSAVTSQPADDFPADLLFKRRARRADVPRSFTLRGGARRAVAALLEAPGIELLTGRRAAAVARCAAGFSVALDDGGTLEAAALALAVPPRATAQLLGGILPAAARAAASVGETEVFTLGCAVRADKVELPYATFLIPLAGDLASVVTRDVVPDPDWRGFAFHFRPGPAPDARLARAAALLGVQRRELEAPAERRSVLPSPRGGHAARIGALDRSLAGERVAVTGNWFGGLAIEDCVLRSRSEWERLARP